ncbi:MAG: hypothetical protein ACHQ2F_03495 [Desulfobaccales bacterium]
MKPWAFMLQSIVNQAIKRSMHLHNRIEELESRRFTSSQAPLFLLKLLTSLNTQICNALIEFSNSTFVPIDYDGYEALHHDVKLLASIIANLYTYLRFAEAACTETNPPGIISAIERITYILMTKTDETEVLVCPSLSCTYSYHDLLSEKNLGSKNFDSLFDKKVFEGKKHFAVFEYPVILQNDALSHTLLMHEVGHLFNEVKSIVPNAYKVLESRRYRYNNTEELQGYLIEYVADIFAVCILGPAFLFAFIEFLTSRALPTEALLPPHPPIIYRIRNIFDTLLFYKQRFGAFLNSPYAKNAEDYLHGLEEHLRPNKINVHKKPSYIFKYLQPALDSARRIVQNKVPAVLKFSPTPRLFDKYVIWVEKGVPPTAYQNLHGKVTPLSLGEILNAAWLYQINNLSSSHQLPVNLQNSDYSMNLMDISRLTQLAIRQNEDLILYKRSGIL